MSAEPLPIVGPSERPRLLLKYRDAALALQICERKLFDLGKRGEIPVVRMGKSVRFDSRDIAAYIDAHKATGGKP